MFYINTLDFCKFQKNPKVLSVDIRNSEEIHKNKEQIKKHNKAFNEFLSTNKNINELYFYFNIECCYTGDCCDRHLNAGTTLFNDIQFPPNLSILSLSRLKYKKSIVKLPNTLKIVIVYDFYSFLNIEYNDNIEQIIIANSDDDFCTDYNCANVPVDEFPCNFSHLYKLKSIKFYNCTYKKSISFFEKYAKQIKLPYGCTTEIISDKHPAYTNNILYTRNK